MRELLGLGLIDRLYWFDTEEMVPDGMAKCSIDRELIILAREHGIWRIRHASPKFRSFAGDEIEA